MKSFYTVGLVAFLSASQALAGPFGSRINFSGGASPAPGAAAQPVEIPGTANEAAKACLRDLNALAARNGQAIGNCARHSGDYPFKERSPATRLEAADREAASASGLIAQTRVFLDRCQAILGSRPATVEACVSAVQSAQGRFCGSDVLPSLLAAHQAKKRECDALSAQSQTACLNARKESLDAAKVLVEKAASAISEDRKLKELNERVARLQRELEEARAQVPVVTRALEAARKAESVAKAASDAALANRDRQCGR